MCDRAYILAPPRFHQSLPRTRRELLNGYIVNDSQLGYVEDPIIRKNQIESVVIQGSKQRWRTSALHSSSDHHSRIQETYMRRKVRAQVGGLIFAPFKNGKCESYSNPASNGFLAPMSGHPSILRCSTMRASRCRKENEIPEVVNLGLPWLSLYYARSIRLACWTAQKTP